MLTQTAARCQERGLCLGEIQVARRFLFLLLEGNKPDMCRTAVRLIRFSRISRIFISLLELSRTVCRTWEEEALASLSFTSLPTNRSFMPR
jgi:hypothetical protein